MNPLRCTTCGQVLPEAPNEPLGSRILTIRLAGGFVARVRMGPLPAPVFQEEATADGVRMVIHQGMPSLEVLPE